MEYYADLGELRKGLSYQEQSHMAGPVFAGKIGHLRYDIGYLAGLSSAAVNITVKCNFEMEF